jgi:hypothetical protein
MEPQGVINFYLRIILASNAVVAYPNEATKPHLKLLAILKILD